MQHLPRLKRSPHCTVTRKGARSSWRFRANPASSAPVHSVCLHGMRTSSSAYAPATPLRTVHELLHRGTGHHCATALQRASSRQFGSGQGAARCWCRCWSRALSRSCMRELGIIIPRRDRQRRTQGFTTTEFYRDEACCSSRCRRVARQLRVGRLVV